MGQRRYIKKYGQTQIPEDYKLSYAKNKKSKKK